MTGIVSSKDPGPPPKNTWGEKGDGNWRWLNQAYNLINALTFSGGISALLDKIGSTRGSVLYRGASGWAILTPGTSGLPIKSGGAGADPSYAVLTVPGGGTGVATLAAHGVLIGAGAGNVVVSGAGTAGQVLTSNGASSDPTFQAIPAVQAYATVQEEGVSLTQRTTLNFIGQSVTAADNSGQTRTDVTLSPQYIQDESVASGLILTIPSGYQVYMSILLTNSGTIKNSGRLAIH